MIFVSTARVVSDPANEYFRNQVFATRSWQQVAKAIVYFGPRQAHLESPITRFVPCDGFPLIRDVVDLCADQQDWCVIINADIWIHPHFKKVEQQLKAKRAVAFSSWRWNFEPAVGVEPCHHNDNGLDVFGAVSEAWNLLYDVMQQPTPRGEVDSPNRLKLGGAQWDSWCLAMFHHLFSSMGFYNITDSRVVRHPIHGGRSYATGIPTPHFPAWPVMPVQSII